MKRCRANPVGRDGRWGPGVEVEEILGGGLILRLERTPFTRAELHVYPVVRDARGEVNPRGGYRGVSFRTYRNWPADRIGLRLTGHIDGLYAVRTGKTRWFAKKTWERRVVDEHAVDIDTLVELLSRDPKPGEVLALKRENPTRRARRRNPASDPLDRDRLILVMPPGKWQRPGRGNVILVDRTPHWGPSWTKGARPETFVRFDGFHPYRTRQLDEADRAPRWMLDYEAGLVRTLGKTNPLDYDWPNRSETVASLNNTYDPRTGAVGAPDFVSERDRLSLAAAGWALANKLPPGVYAMPAGLEPAKIAFRRQRVYEGKTGVRLASVARWRPEDRP